MNETQLFHAPVDAERDSKNTTNLTEGENMQSGTQEKTSDSQRAKMGGKPVFVVPAKTIINFKSGFKPKLLCDGPTFTTGTCCPYSCSFCSVPTTMFWQLQPNGWLTKQGVTGKHQDIVVRRKNAVEIARNQLTSHPKKWRQEKKVIYASPLTDVAANMELVRETVEICKVILELTNWDIRLLSKSNLLPKVAIALDEMKGAASRAQASQRVIYGVSTGTLDDNLAKAFEEGTPLVSKRIESLHWLQDNGFRTFGMICPSLPQSGPAGYLLFAKAMFDAIRAERCEHVWAEVINVRGESFTRTTKTLTDAGYDADAGRLKDVSENKDAWEEYARLTFQAHCEMPYKPGQLRFLQYVNKQTRDWWKRREELGAVLL